MEKYLIVVDMQNDFISGSLGTPEAKAIVDCVCEKIKSHEGKVVFTFDTHEKNYIDTQEGQNLPVVHCVYESEGWEHNPEIVLIREDLENERRAVSFNKDTFGSKELGEYLLKKNEESQIESIELIGLCTDICVISNALLIKAFLPEVPIIVDSACCAGVTPESHENALNAMKMCQIKII